MNRLNSQVYNLVIMAFHEAPKVLIKREEIDSVIKKLAQEITRDYYDKNPLIISILKGSFMFTADLIRHLDFPLEIEFVRLSSYGKGKESTGKIDMIQGIHVPIEGRHVLILEDIVDTGRTIAFLIDYLSKQKPASLKLCALADKPMRRKVSINIDYLGFTVPNKFIVGYGIDWDEKYRYLPDICVLDD